MLFRSRIDWVHIPALNRSDREFYAPLARLATGDARIYLGMIHSMESFAQRLAVARSVLPDFGLAAYCGFGRTPPDQLPKILDDHLKAAAVAAAATVPPSASGRRSTRPSTIRAASR